MFEHAKVAVASNMHNNTKRETPENHRQTKKYPEGKAFKQKMPPWNWRYALTLYFPNNAFAKFCHPFFDYGLLIMKLSLK